MNINNLVSDEVTNNLNFMFPFWPNNMLTTTASC